MFHLLFINTNFISILIFGLKVNLEKKLMGIGDWGLGIGDWG